MINLHIAGSIPLRQLVYRVLDLPQSMRPLVYDFGQLNPETEKDYTKQIVFDHVSDPFAAAIMLMSLVVVVLSCFSGIEY